MRYRWAGLKNKGSEVFLLDFLRLGHCYIFSSWYVFPIVTYIFRNETLCLNICFIAFPPNCENNCSNNLNPKSTYTINILLGLWKIYTFSFSMGFDSKFKIKLNHEHSPEGLEKYMVS